MVIDLNNIGEVRNNNQDVIKRIYGNHNNVIWEKHIEYDESLYKNQPLTIENLENETVKFYIRGNGNISIKITSYNNDEWYDMIINNTEEIYIHSGDKISIKCDYTKNTNYISLIKLIFTNNTNFAKFNLYGNITSLIYKDFYGKETQSYKDSKYSSIFSGLFFNSGVVDASNLVMPSGELSFQMCETMFRNCKYLSKAPQLPSVLLYSHCYDRMFYNCDSLTEAPVLPALVLKELCYDHMFARCKNLNYIKMMATDISANNCMDSWVTRVSENGTFIKNSAATWTETGTSGIPSGWTVETASS